MSHSQFDPTKPPPLGRSAYGVFAPPGDDQALAHWRAWQAHVDAGRIGNNPPCPPEVAARRERNEALFRRLAGRG